jgi:hypothetical protein
MKRFGKTLAALSTALLVNGAALAAGPLTNFTGLWWNPEESGWGLGIDHQGDIVFGTLFTYDNAGNPTWYVMSRMEKEELNPFRGPVDNYMGDIYRANAIGAQRDSIYAREVDVADMGDAVLSFQSELGNILAYNVGETNVYKRISPLVFNGAAPLCTADAEPGDSPNYQGLWVNSPLGSERWGVYLAHQGEVIFGVAFAYDGDGNPTWRSMALVKNESGAYVGDLINSTGPGPSSDTPFDPALVTRTAVGSATLSFGDAETGVFAATMNGTPLPVKDIGRIRFAESRTTCK